jgi:ComEC/Rec2-related protein
LKSALSIELMRFIPQLRSAPAVFGAFYLVCGVWSLAASALLGGNICFHAISAAFASLLVWLFVRESRGSAFMIILGAVLAWWYLDMPWHDYTDELARRQGGSDIRGICVDPAYSAEELKWLLEPSGIIVRVTSIRRPGTDSWTPCRGRVLLRSEDDISIPYGTRLMASGAFLQRPRKVIDAEFDYGRYLRIRGVQRLFDAQQLRAVGMEGGRYWPLRIVYSLRELCVERLNKALSSRDAQSILPAMTLGYRQGLTGPVRRSFIRSGIVHVFAISGLHVGIAAALIGAVLQLLRISYRFRFLVLPVLIGLYVLMTGAAPSAVRAWMMISIWCAGRASLRPVSPVNTVAAAAVVLLLINPLMLFDQGFVFSFAVVGVLVLGWTVATPVENALSERWFWLPQSRRGGWWGHARRRFCTRSAGLILGSVLASMGSAGLIVGTQGLLIPGAILVNALTALLAWWVILLAGIKVVFGGLTAVLPVLDGVLAGVLEVFVAGMLALVSFGRGEPMSFSVGVPNAGWIIAYYLIVACAMMFVMTFRCRLLWFSTALIVLLSGVFQAQVSRRDTVAVFQGGETSFPVVAADVFPNLPPLLINAGAYWTGARVADWLGDRGCDELDCLLLAGWGRDRAGGVKRLLQRASVNTVVLPDAWRSSPWLAKDVENAFMNGVRIREYDYPWRDGNGDELWTPYCRLAVGRHLGDFTMQLATPNTVNTVSKFELHLCMDRFLGSRIVLNLPCAARYQFYLPFQLLSSCYEFVGEEVADNLDLDPTGGIFQPLSDSGP